jgi:iron-sulfur cluster repair protein YtfE (RIC family)
MSVPTIPSFFEKDHRRLDALFENFQNLKQQDFSEAQSFFKEFKQGLEKHILWEEEILFPFFEKKSGISSGPTEVMKQEHSAILKALQAIHQKVAQRDLQTGAEEKELFEILMKHNLKEENVLYPMIETEASPMEKKEIFKAMDEIHEKRYSG